MSYPFTLANVHGRAEALTNALDGPVVVALNEAAALHVRVRRDPAWGSCRLGSNVLAWRRDRVTFRQSWRREILPAGGRLGRRWKASTAVLALLEVDGQPVLHGVTHFPSRAWTVWPWRRRAWFAAQAGLLDFVADVRGRTPVILSGDFNRGGDWEMPGYRTAASPITFGRRGRYDRVFIQGPVDLDEVEAVDVGSDHRAVRATIHHRKESAVTAFPAPSPVYLGPAAHTSSGDNKPIERIVIHATVSKCEPGMARRIASYFRSEAARGSAHYVIDPGEVVQVVYDNVIAWHAPPNPHSIGNELCYMPTKVRVGFWLTPNARKMLRLAARLTAEQCLAFGVPAVRLKAADLRAGRRGVCGHVDVSEAWGQSTHWDPGVFPWWRFMRMVRAEIVLIKAPAAPPKPTRVSRARALLVAALKFAGPRRKAAIQSGLDDIPER